MTLDNYSNIIRKSLANDEKVERIFSFSSLYLNIKMIISFIGWAFLLSLIVVVLLIIQKNTPDFLELNRDLSPSYDFADNLNINNNLLVNIDSNNDSINFLQIAILVYIFLIIPLILFYFLFYIKISNEFVFTSNRVIVKKGWIGTKTISAKYNRITDINVSQSLIERIFKTGTLSINTAGSEGYELILKHVAHPYRLKKDLHTLKEKYIQANFKYSFNTKN